MDHLHTDIRDDAGNAMGIDAFYSLAIADETQASRKRPWPFHDGIIADETGPEEPAISDDHSHHRSPALGVQDSSVCLLGSVSRKSNGDRNWSPKACALIDCADFMCKRPAG